MSKAKAAEDFVLKGTISELDWKERDEEQITKELFKGSDPDKMIDAYEEQLGIKTHEPTKKNTRYKHVMLSPSTNEDDDVLLDKFFNSPDQYQVLNRADYWTNRGELKIFIEYLEDMDVRREKEARENSTTI